MPIVKTFSTQKILCLFLLISSVACSDNLVQNPSAETVPLTNEWKIVSGRWTQRTKAPVAQDGKAYFFPSVVLHGELYQDIDVTRYRIFTDMGLMTAEYAAYMRVFPQIPPDRSREVIEFRNADSTRLDSIASMYCDSTKSWIKFTDKKTLPKGTRFIRVRLLSDRYNGSNNDGYHDNISLTLSLAWWVFVVLIAILLFIIWMVIRSKRRSSVLARSGAKKR